MAEETPLEISAAAAKRLLWEAHPGEILLVDCRTAEENTIAAIAGATLLPMQELGGRIAELAPWRDRPIIVHCHHGIRSLQVTHWLRERGFTHVSSMRGGIDAWSTEVDPAVPRY